MPGALTPEAALAYLADAAHQLIQLIERVAPALHGDEAACRAVVMFDELLSDAIDHLPIDLTPAGATPARAATGAAKGP